MTSHLRYAEFQNVNAGTELSSPNPTAIKRMLLTFYAASVLNYAKKLSHFIFEK